MEEIRGFSYDVALSFAGEDREVAEQLAEQLKKAGVTVFYDNWERSNLWGKDLYQHLDHVYGHAAQFCIVLISASYANKAWTNHELRAAQARAFQQHAEYILPVRLDNTELKSIPVTIGYVDLRATSIYELANMLIAKLRRKTNSKIEADTSHEQGRSFRIPRIPRVNFDPVQETHNLIAHIENVLDQRVTVLRDAGLSVRKDVGEGGARIYRVTYKNRLVYFFSMRVKNDFGRQVISFLDGWSEPISDNSATAFGTIHTSLDKPDPSVQITNFSLLDDPGMSVLLTYEELSEAIWEKACKVIEQIVPQIR